MKQSDLIDYRRRSRCGFLPLARVFTLLFLSLSICLATANIAVAQTKQITGTVVADEDGQPVIGAIVVVEGTSNGVIVGQDGRFSINANPDDVLKITFQGFTPQTKKVGAAANMDFRLVEDVKTLTEVVTIGYGSQKRVNLTGAVATVDMTELEGKPVVSLTEALQGTTPGLIITQGTSKPGSNLSVNVRGLNTMNDNNPLILIDGVEGDIHGVNPSDIEQISVLKDASASIYGSRGGNGVILITTKKGSIKKTNVNYEFRYGLQTPTGLPKLADSWVYAELRNEALINSDLAPEYTTDQIAAFRNGTAPNSKWIEQIYRDFAPMQTHNINVSGGENRTTYFFSVGYADQESLFKNTDNFGMKKLNLRLNMTHQVNDRLKFAANAFYNRKEIRNTSYWEEWIIEQSIRTPPVFELKIGDEYQYPLSYAHNPLARLEKGGYNLGSYDEVGGIFNAEYKIIDNLTFKGMGAANITNHRSHSNRHSIIEATSTDNSWQLYESASRDARLTSNLLLNYDRAIGRHSFEVMGGFAYEGFHTSNFATDRGADGKVIPETGYDVLREDALGSADLRVVNSGGARDRSLYSVVGRATYNYDDRYLFDFNIRNDHSSKFAKGNRSGVFPSLQGAWRISQEEFYGGVRAYVPSLKLRTSWGLLGNDRIDDYKYQSVIGIGQNGYVFGDTPVMTMGYGAANNQLKWETTRMLNFGLDVGLLKNQMNVSFDLFDNMTRDILLELPIPSTYGGGTPLQNAGVVHTWGWEFNLNYKFRTGEFSHSLAANLSDSQNRVVSLEDEEKETYINILWEGQPMWAYYGYKTDGYFQNDAEVLAGPRTSFITKPGDIRFVDKDGDGEITPENDKYILGTRDPRYTFGFSYGIEWRGIDFSFFLQGVGKRTAWLRGESVEAFHNNNIGPVLEMHIDRWTPTNPDASYPRLTATISEGANNYQNSTFWLQNAAYMRVKNIQLGYTLPTQLTQKIKIRQARIFASVQNPFTISKMIGTGWDPEYGEGSGRTYPVTKTYSLGVDLKF